MSEQPELRPEPGIALLELYEEALPHVYGYLASRCRSTALAQDLTAETFLAAVSAARAGTAPAMGTGWLIGVARHKLVDHWRRQEREHRGLAEVAAAQVEHEDPWEATVDALHTHAVLDRLGPHHRAALTLRYLDALPVSEVAAALGRTLHATEALLVRARTAFRAACAEGEATS